MYKLKIKVTKEILRRSMMCGTENELSPTIGMNCAVALAVRDIFPDAFVSHSNISPLFGKYYSMYAVPLRNVSKFMMQLPESVVEFIKEFDVLKACPEARLTMKELEFEVNVPDGLISEIDISKVTQDHETLKLIEI